MDTLKLITKTPHLHIPDVTLTDVRVLLLTFSVLVLYLHSHFFLAVHPGQPHLLGSRSLANVLAETVRVLRAPRETSSLTNNSPPGGLIL